MTIPQSKCKECGFEDDVTNMDMSKGLCQTCAEEKICPKCKSDKICNIPSSTLPIKNGRWIFNDKKVPKPILDKHKSVSYICANCLYEW